MPEQEITPAEVTTEVTPSPSPTPEASPESKIDISGIEKILGPVSSGDTKKEDSSKETPKSDTIEVDLQKSTKEEVKTEEQKSPEEPPTQPGEVGRPGRDYSGLSEREVQMFKGMTRTAFETLKPIYLEHKQLKDEIKTRDTRIKALEDSKETLPSSWYEHENAYVLSPEFAQLSSNLDTSQAIAKH